MLILSLDSAGDGCSVCVWQDGRVLSLVHERMERGQDRRLMPLVLEVLQKAHVSFDALDRVAVTRGPGSFTGLRIGLAAARGIGLAAGKPVIGIDRFAIFRAATPTADKHLLVVIQSKRKELYARFYAANGSATEAMMLTPDEIQAFLADKGETIVTGDLATPAEGGMNEAVTCAALAAEADPADAAFLPRPLYIRPPDVTLKAPRIEPATAHHAPLLALLHAESFGAEAWSLAQLQGSLALATTRGWVAYHNNEPAGFLLCQTMPEQAEILTFCVRPSHQRRGIGTLVLREAMDDARRDGNALFLEVAADNVAAATLYEKAGFVRIGNRPGYYRRDGVRVDGVMYRLEAPRDDLEPACSSH